MNSTAILSVNEYSFFCSLGCSSDERAQLQEVRASVKIEFSRLPQVCLSDELVDTVCYADLCSAIKKVAEAKSFKTVEHLSHEIHLRIRQIIPEEHRWYLAVQKVKPPIDGLKNGVTFQIGNIV